MEWTNAKVCELIELYRDRPVLWNCRLKEYKDRNKKQDGNIFALILFYLPHPISAFSSETGFTLYSALCTIFLLTINTFHIPFRDHISPYLRSNNLLNIEGRFSYLLCVFLYKVYKHRSPGYLLDSLEKRSDTHTVHLRTDSFTIPIFRTSTFKGSERATSM
ncbi:hypothetical protein RI129_004704 [Pyrocoelia pectoralis]|uniref:MADF domain-containing protein n=1 Tax=Pyrocoelia pectoralis TaxID=417401 RepID=A0AAN7VCV2_9COLE